MGSLQPDDRHDRSSRDPEVAGEFVQAKRQGMSTTNRAMKGRFTEAMLSVMTIRDLITLVGSDRRLLQRR